MHDLLVELGLDTQEQPLAGWQVLEPSVGAAPWDTALYLWDGRGRGPWQGWPAPAEQLWDGVQRWTRRGED